VVLCSALAVLNARNDDDDDDDDDDDISEKML